MIELTYLLYETEDCSECGRNKTIIGYTKSFDTAKAWLENGSEEYYHPHRAVCFIDEVSLV